MKDLMGMMKAAQEMKGRMEEFQNSLEALRIDGRSGGGMVSVTLNGKGELQGLSIDPTLFKEDSVEVLEDLIVAAHNDAKGKLDLEIAQKSQDITAGLPIPPGLKFPF
jgi:DNA-binding YbaB/EbfC family protein